MLDIALAYVLGPVKIVLLLWGGGGVPGIATTEFVQLVAALLGAATLWPPILDGVAASLGEW